MNHFDFSILEPPMMPEEASSAARLREDSLREGD